MQALVELLQELQANWSQTLNRHILISTVTATGTGKDGVHGEPVAVGQSRQGASASSDGSEVVHPPNS